MVKLDAFDVQLDSPNGCYFAGQTIKGDIIAGLQMTIKVKEMSVTLKGEAKTNWVNKVSDNIYDSLEPYINERKVIKYLAHETDGETLLPGTHRIPFTFQLPHNLPSSYEGEFGYVRYSLVAQVDLSPDVSCIMPNTKGKEITHDRPITVLANVELRQISLNASTPLRKEESFEIVGCCGSGGHVNASLTIPSAALVAGQPYTMQVTLENHSRRGRLDKAVVNFVQEVHFRSVSFFQSASDSKTVSRIIDSATLNSPEQGKTLTKEVTLRVPGDLPATSVANTIITVRYKVRLEMGRQLEIVIPVGVATKA